MEENKGGRRCGGATVSWEYGHACPRSPVRMNSGEHGARGGSEPGTPSRKDNTGP